MAEESVGEIYKAIRERDGALPAGRPGQVREQLAAPLAGGVMPDKGLGIECWPDLLRGFVSGSVNLTAETVAANLHAPVLAISAVADFVAGITNQSVDAWESGPSGIVLEQELIATLGSLLGYEANDGTLTPGSTQSNLLALLYARERAYRAAGLHDPFFSGISEGRVRFRILASELAHVSIQRAAGVLGLGQDAVLSIPVDGRKHMIPEAVTKVISTLGDNEVPMALVGTAGTTDFGSIDPLGPLAEIAEAHSIWFHVDAAYGGMGMLSARIRESMKGIERADSVSMDLHKLGWQPAPAAVMLLRDPATAGSLDCNVACINPADDEEAGYRGLFARTLQTTRRADALKIVATLRALGRDGMGCLVDSCLDLADHAAARISAHPRLRLVIEPELSVVVFRYVPAADRGPQEENRINSGIRRRLMRDFGSSVGRVETFDSAGFRKVFLKFTFVNPALSRNAVDELIDLVVRAGRIEEENR